MKNLMYENDVYIFFFSGISKKRTTFQLNHLSDKSEMIGLVIVLRETWCSEIYNATILLFLNISIYYYVVVYKFLNILF